MKSKYFQDNRQVGMAGVISAVIVVSFIIMLHASIRTAFAGHEEVDGMVLVPAGKFIFGDKDEGTQETIDLKAFYIDKYEVTNEAYKKVKHDHKFPPDKAKHPVVNVSWHDANTYCKALGKRLPSEEEREKAARGTDERLYPWGKAFDKAKANTREAGIKGTVPVGSYESGKSPYGIYDMAGNVREWTDNWYDEKKIYKSVRGGGYIDAEDAVFTFTVRKSIPEDTKAYIGFRCAK
ncbi:MAG: SUMF1/EgtB/PvdO family nonheme iron enzyme [Thermodesulfovibrionales bacterium]|nr:SUMF1/EgtB/PvdO family nonheme iron enzyme [Thermodesulfovibrionales bacterium]